MQHSGSADIIAERHQRILEIARRTGSVLVDELAAQFDVTPQTIRKDLNELARKSMLSRVHGGAVVTSGVDNIAYESRRLVASPAKAAIGAAAARLVPNGASLFINIGTTTEAIATALADHRDLLVISNNLNVVDILRSNRTIETIVVGGRVRQSDRAVVGPHAMSFISGFKVDFALIGASAIDPDGTLLDFDINEVQVSQTIIQNARRVILAADHSKIGRPAPVRIGNITDIDYFVTDSLENATLREICRNAEVTLVETESTGD